MRASRATARPAPSATKPGFASVCEGFGGLRYINGFPGGPPVRPNLSLGDTLAALHAVIGVLLALVHRNRIDGERHRRPGPGRRRRDLRIGVQRPRAMVPEYDGAGIVREPSGSTLTGIVPTNTYPCADGRYVIIGGNADSIFKRLMRAAGRDDLADDPRLADNAGRVAHQPEVDDAIAEWTRTLDSDRVLEILDDAGVPAGPIYSVADMADDPQYNARGLFETVEVSGEPLKIPALVPKLDGTPGATLWPGPELGAHNREIYIDTLGLDEKELRALSRATGSSEAGTPVAHLRSDDGHRSPRPANLECQATGRWRVDASPDVSPIHKARTRRCPGWQGERESGRAGVRDGTSSTLAEFNAANPVSAHPRPGIGETLGMVPGPQPDRAG